MARPISVETSSEVGLWDTARVSPEAEVATQCHLLFGYGSLLWKVDFPIDADNSFFCTVEDPSFRRRFWMRSSDHRGTVDKPGRVATLVKLPDPKTESDDLLFGAEQVGQANIRREDGVGLVHGVCLCLRQEGIAETIKHLDFRERHGYTRTITNVRSVVDQTVHTAFVYYYSGPTTSSEFPGAASEPTPGCQLPIAYGEPIEETARIIASSIGPSGRNIEYLESMVDALRSRGARDAYLEKLHELALQFKDLSNDELLGA